LRIVLELRPSVHVGRMRSRRRFYFSSRLRCSQSQRAAQSAGQCAHTHMRPTKRRPERCATARSSRSRERRCWRRSAEFSRRSLGRNRSHRRACIRFAVQSSAHCVGSYRQGARMCSSPRPARRSPPLVFLRMLQRTGRAAKLAFTVHPHMLRHACGYKLANDGHDTRSLAHYLGHRNLQSTARFAGLFGAT
jgi:integrase